jgi:hypothetical protein
MKMTIKPVAPLLALLAATTVTISNADVTVYEKQSIGGTPEFSDTYKPGKELVNVPSPNIMQPVKENPAPSASGTVKENEPVRILIQTPSPQQSIWSGNGDITVAFSTEGESGSALKYIIYLDGIKAAETNSQSATLTGVDRGEHQLFISALDDQGNEVARTARTIIYVHRPSIRK